MHSQDVEARKLSLSLFHERLVKNPLPRIDEDTASSSLQSSSARISTAMDKLTASNDILESKLKMLRSNTVRLQLDISKLQRHVNAFHGELLVTWQADTLTRLIEEIYERHKWKLPGGVTPDDHGIVDRDTMAVMYGIAVRKLQKETLRHMGLSQQHWDALQKYDEIAQYRSMQPYRTECSFAKWLLSKKRSQVTLYQFWGQLFPICYGRTVEEASEIF